MTIKDIKWARNVGSGSMWSGELLFGTFYTLSPVDGPVEEGKTYEGRWDVEFGQFLSENDHETLYIVPTLDQAQKLAQDHFAKAIGEWIANEKDEWIPWIPRTGAAGVRPVASDVKVHYRMRDGDVSTRPEIAANLDWTHNNRNWDIVDYKLA